MPNPAVYRPIICQRATAALPAGTQAAIFTVVGRIWLLQLFGEVTTGLGVDAVNTLRAMANPDVGVDSNLCANSGATALSGLDAGTFLGISGTVTDALLVAADGGAALRGESVPVLIRACTIDLVTATTQTGSVQWTLIYVPIDQDSIVTPA